MPPHSRIHQFSHPAQCPWRILTQRSSRLPCLQIDPKSCNPRSLQNKLRLRSQTYPKVFLGGLPPSVTETDLRTLFGVYGHVMEVVIMYDQEKRKSRGTTRPGGGGGGRWGVLWCGIVASQVVAWPLCCVALCRVGL